MEMLTRQRCLHHPERQAVARCPGCGSFHCRECITEHDGRVMCAGCLKQLLKPQETGKGKRGVWVKRATSIMAKAGAAIVGVFVVWLFFFLCGKALVAIPTSFHDGTVWKTGGMGDDE